MAKAKQIRPFPEHRAFVDPGPRCSADVKAGSGYTREWRKSRYGGNGDLKWQKCTFPSVVLIDGKPYCRRHGGEVALDILLRRRSEK